MKVRLSINQIVCQLCTEQFPLKDQMQSLRNEKELYFKRKNYRVDNVCLLEILLHLGAFALYANANVERKI